MLITCLKTKNINTIIQDALGNELTFKFYYKSIHSNFKNNKFKWTILDVKCIMIRACKTESTQYVGETSF